MRLRPFLLVVGLILSLGAQAEEISISASPGEFNPRTLAPASSRSSVIAYVRITKFNGSKAWPSAAYVGFYQGPNRDNSVQFLIIRNKESDPYVVAGYRIVEGGRETKVESLKNLPLETKVHVELSFENGAVTLKLKGHNPVTIHTAFTEVVPYVSVSSGTAEFNVGTSSINTDLFVELMGFAVYLLIPLLVWNYYRHRTYAIDKRYTTFGPRFWTGFVDGGVLWPIGFAATYLLSFDVPRLVAALIVIIENLVWLFYTVILHARNGQTVGKMVTKVQVVDFRTEGKISYWQALLREGIPTILSLGMVGYEVFAILTNIASPKDIVSGEAIQDGPFWLLMVLPSLWFVAELLTMLTNKKRRALHDFIAGTVVIRTNALIPAVDSTLPAGKAERADYFRSKQLSE